MPRRYHGLKKIKVRQDWSRETLYNLSRLENPRNNFKTFFQQKWAAKAAMRAYHNDYVREGTWTRMFDRRLPAVVPMDHRYLARHDGSERARGTGRGQQDVAATEGEQQKRDPPKTPYMHMTFGPLERRLDTAIWRSLFSSSVKQARQFVTHGWVKVNGKKMIYPGYQLNPGDMFQVEPERVMYATGARKVDKNSPLSNREASPKKVAAKTEETEEEGQLEGEEAADGEAGGDSVVIAATPEIVEEVDMEEGKDAKSAMKSLITRAKRILDDSKRTLSGKRQQELRAFSQSIKKLMSKHRATPEGEAAAEETVDTLETALAEIMTKIPTDSIPTETDAPAVSSNPQAEAEDVYAARKDAELLHSALERARANPIDASKPYATPWKPRDYMSAFAFIPRYLEVNQNICSAVYLRHPVARPGLAEVPTPFNNETATLAFNWYLRRR